jgi:hypothetical protein
LLAAKKDILLMYLEKPNTKRQVALLENPYLLVTASFGGLMTLQFISTTREEDNNEA